MRNWAEIKARYLRDTLPIRLGGIAANLARAHSFTRNPLNEQAVEGLLEESKYLIEWTAPDAEVDAASRLVELQIQLALWQRDWKSIWGNPAQRQAVADRCQAWSDQVLEMSGLLD
jgi:hypothetical protein